MPAATSARVFPPGPSARYRAASRGKSAAIGFPEKSPSGCVRRARGSTLGSFRRGERREESRGINSRSVFIMITEAITCRLVGSIVNLVFRVRLDLPMRLRDSYDGSRENYSFVMLTDVLADAESRAILSRLNPRNPARLTRVGGGGDAGDNGSVQLISRKSLRRSATRMARSLFYQNHLRSFARI